MFSTVESNTGNFSTCEAMSWGEQLCNYSDCLLVVLPFSVAQGVAQRHSEVWRIKGSHLAAGKLVVGIMWGHGEVPDIYSTILLMPHSDVCFSVDSDGGSKGSLSSSVSLRTVFN